MLNTNFDMKDLEAVKKILVMTIERDRSKFSLKIQQHDYLIKAIHKFSMYNCKTVSVLLVG